MSASEPAIRIRVDPSNPGQFFACCGLLEIGHRLWGWAEGWFEGGRFLLRAVERRGLSELMDSLTCVPLEQVVPGDDYSSPLRLGEPLHLMLDWWTDRCTGGDRLKVWAGSMRPGRIARAMQTALRPAELHTEAIFDLGMVVFDPEEPDKKVEPYYFDGRRGRNALSRDIGFAPDALQMTTAAYPAVEFLCLIGLQRARPVPAGSPRVFEYCIWGEPCPPSLVPAACCGLLPISGVTRYRFENGFRTDQKKHKAFMPAIPVGGSR